MVEIGGKEVGGRREVVRRRGRRQEAGGRRQEAGGRRGAQQNMVWCK